MEGYLTQKATKFPIYRFKLLFGKKVTSVNTVCSTQSDKVIVAHYCMQKIIRLSIVISNKSIKWDALYNSVSV